MSNDSNYKLLFIAYACEPGRGSEWGLGWHYVADLSRTQPVWVITHADNKAGLETYLREKHTGYPVHVTYVELPRFLGWMRNSLYTLFNIHYYLWQFAAARAAKRVHRQVKLDLVQHVSLFRWWMPSAGAALVDEGVGFIFGPVGGGDVLPKGFSKKSPVYSKASDLLRFVARSIWRQDPLLKRCIRKAHLLLAGVPSCETWFRSYGATNIETICAATAGAPELAVTAKAARATKNPAEPFTFASCGGLSYYRGVDLAVRAFAKANLPNARYIHLCDGPMRQSIEELARELGVADRVQLLGDMPYIECLRHVAKADAVVHTVLRDSQGALVEAMMAGVPVMTFDHLTPAMLVTDECGVKIHIDDRSRPDDIVDAIAAEMRDWYERPEMLAKMSEAAKRRGEQFTAEAKGAQYRAFHHQVLRELRGTAPVDAMKRAVVTPVTPEPRVQRVA